MSVFAAMSVVAMAQISGVADLAKVQAYVVAAAAAEGADYDPDSVQLRHVSSNPEKGRRWVCGEFAGTLRSGEKTDFRGFIFNVKKPIVFFQPVEKMTDRDTFLLEQAEYHEASANWC